MQCNICGNDNALWNSSARQVICGECIRNTPDKVDFETFRLALWTPEERKEHGCVPTSIEREFYSDYIASTQDLTDYCAGVVECEDISD